MTSEGEFFVFIFFSAEFRLGCPLNTGLHGRYKKGL